MIHTHTSSIDGVVLYGIYETPGFIILYYYNKDQVSCFAQLKLKTSMNIPTYIIIIIMAEMAVV